MDIIFSPNYLLFKDEVLLIPKKRWEFKMHKNYFYLMKNKDFYISINFVLLIFVTLCTVLPPCPSSISVQNQVKVLRVPWRCEGPKASSDLADAWGQLCL